MQRKNCRHYYNKIDGWSKVNGYTAKLIENPHREKNKMAAGRCQKDCQWYEPKTT